MNRTRDRYQCTLHIGDLGVELVEGQGCELVGLAHDIEGRYKGFLSTEPGEFRIELHTLDSDPLPLTGYDPVVRIEGDLLSIVSPALTAKFDLARREGRIAVAPDPVGAVYFLENALRQIAQVILVERQAVLLHAAGVSHPSGDRAYVFPGRSGAGKSTISALLRSAGGRVLSDDLVLLDTSKETPMLAATPFFGTLLSDTLLSGGSDAPERSGRCTFSLAGIHFLEQASSAALIEINDASSGVALLVANAPFAGCFDRVHRQRLLDTLLAAVRMVPVRKLRFRRDLSMLPLLDWPRTVECGELP